VRERACVCVCVGVKRKWNEREWARMCVKERERGGGRWQAVMRGEENKREGVCMYV